MKQVLVRWCWLSLLLLAVAIVPSSSYRLLHRQKRACPINYSSCGWGCCANGAQCGYGYYPCGGNCCGPVVCPSGFTACADSSTNCCPMSCSGGGFQCDGGSNYGGSYCCSSGTTCCAPTYSGSGGLCCDGTAQDNACGNLNQACCPPNNSNFYSPYCNFGSCNSGTCS